MDLTKIASPDSTLFHKPLQIGVVVRDMKEKMAFFKDVLGLEPFNEAKLAPGMGITYYGKDADSQAHLVFYKFSGLIIELIQPTGGKSVWQDFLDSRGEGIICVLFDVSDLEKVKETMAKEDIKIVQSGRSARFEGVTWNYFNTLDKLGYYINAFNPSEMGV